MWIDTSYVGIGDIYVDSIVDDESFKRFEKRLDELLMRSEVKVNIVDLEPIEEKS